MTTPGGGQDKPAGFSSPMGTGNMAKRASAAAAADLAALASSAATYRKNMEEAAKAAKAATAEVKKQQDTLKDITVLSRTAAEAKVRATGGASGSGVGGGAAMPSLPGWLGGFPAGSSSVPTGPLPAAPARMAANGGSRGTPLPASMGGQQAMPAAMPAAPRFPRAERMGTAVGGGVGRAVGAVAAIGGALATAAGVNAAAGAFTNAVNTDYLANRMAMTSAGGYNKYGTANRMIGYTRNAYIDDADRTTGLMALRRSGFAENTAGFSAMAAGARQASVLDPMRGYGASAAVQVGLSNPALFNNLRMMTGVETLGRDGAPRNIGDVSRDLVRSMGGGAAPLTSTQLAASAGPTGSLTRQMEAAGMSADMQSSILDYLRSASEAGSYDKANASLAKAKPGGPTADTALQLQREQTTAEQRVVTTLLEPTMQAYEKIMTATTAATNKLADVLEGMPEAVRAAIGAGIAASGAVKGELGGGGTNSFLGGVLGAGLASGAGRMLGRGRGGGSRAGGAVRGAARAAGKAARFIPGVGWLAGGALSLGMGARDADYSGNYGSDALSILGNGIDNFTFGLTEFGDGPGRRREPVRVSQAAWGGVAGAEMGGSDEGGGGNSRGKGTVSYLKELMARSGLPYRVTSEKRSGSGGSYHNTGHAIDIAGPTPGVDTKEMLAINRYLAGKLGAAATELIYSGPGGTNLYRGRPHTYSPAVQKKHHDHVHVAVTEASLGKVGQAVGAASEQDEARMMRDEKKQARESRKRRAGGRRTGGILRQGRAGSLFSERSLIADFFSGSGMGRMAARAPGDDPGEANAGGGASGGVGAAGVTVGAHAIDKFLYGLRSHESRGDYEAENGGTRGAGPGGDSSASGAYQYLDSTWNNYRGYKFAAAAPPGVQDERARQDASRLYSKYGNWRYVAAAHLAGEGWVAKNSDQSKWGVNPAPGSKNPQVSAYVKDVLARGGLPETGDGPGGPLAGAPTTLGDVPAPMEMRGRGRGAGGVQVTQNRGGTVHIAKVEVHLQTPQVSEQEARRIGKMVVDNIAREARLREMSG